MWAKENFLTWISNVSTDKSWKEKTRKDWQTLLVLNDRGKELIKNRDDAKALQTSYHLAKDWIAGRNTLEALYEAIASHGTAAERQFSAVSLSSGVSSFNVWSIGRDMDSHDDTTNLPSPEYAKNDIFLPEEYIVHPSDPLPETQASTWPQPLEQPAADSLSSLQDRSFSEVSSYPIGKQESVEWPLSHSQEVERLIHEQLVDLALDGIEKHLSSQHKKSLGLTGEREYVRAVRKDKIFPVATVRAEWNLAEKLGQWDVLTSSKIQLLQKSVGQVQTGDISDVQSMIDAYKNQQLEVSLGKKIALQRNVATLLIQAETAAFGTKNLSSLLAFNSEGKIPSPDWTEKIARQSEDITPEMKGLMDFMEKQPLTVDLDDAITAYLSKQSQDGLPSTQSHTWSEHSEPTSWFTDKKKHLTDLIQKSLKQKPTGKLDLPTKIAFIASREPLASIKSIWERIKNLNFDEAKVALSPNEASNLQRYVGQKQTGELDPVTWRIIKGYLSEPERTASLRKLDYQATLQERYEKLGPTSDWLSHFELLTKKYYEDKTPYKLGGKDGYGRDCSGLVCEVSWIDDIFNTNVAKLDTDTRWPRIGIKDTQAGNWMISKWEGDNKGDNHIEFIVEPPHQIDNQRWIMITYWSAKFTPAFTSRDGDKLQTPAAMSAVNTEYIKKEWDETPVKWKNKWRKPPKEVKVKIEHTTYGYGPGYRYRQFEQRDGHMVEIDENNHPIENKWIYFRPGKPLS